MEKKVTDSIVRVSNDFGVPVIIVDKLENDATGK